MKLFVLIGVFTVIFLSAILVLGSIKNNIDGYFDELQFSNMKLGERTTVDLSVIFKIVNNSKFDYSINKLKVDIYNNITNKKIGETEVIGKFNLKKGISTQKFDIYNVNLFENLNDYVNGNSQILVIISFRILGIKIEFDQVINV